MTGSSLTRVALRLARDHDDARRLSAFALYASFAPLAFGVELAFGGFAAHPVAVTSAAALLLTQGLVCLWRGLPEWAWEAMVVTAPLAWLLNAYAHPDAASALAIALVIPVGWSAVFRSTGGTVASIVLCSGVAASLLLHHGVTLATVLSFTVQATTLTGVGATVHVLVRWLMHARHQAEERANRDSVTGALSRAHACELLDDQLTATRDTFVTPGVLVIDIDHFKDVNDRLGHAAGDDVLREVVARMGLVLRSSDRLARWGGEEFLVILPGVSSHLALESLADRVRRSVESHAFVVGHDRLHVTVSIGAARVRPGLWDADSLVEAADAALYAAKRAGRNRAVVYRAGGVARLPAAA
jgi:diguanylate cyclase (GGDEF)-like protein